MKVQPLYIISLLLLLAASSCHQEVSLVQPLTTKGVYITNEGDFNSGQAEVSFYNPTKLVVTNNLFYSINGYHLGDVAQSIYIKDSTGFIVVNNSAKVEVVKIPSLKHILTITIPNSSPRYFLPINDSIAYVTDLYGGAIHVINYKTGAVTSNITGVAKWTEHMVMASGNVVVEERSLSDTCTTGSVITINPVTNALIQRYSFAGNNVDGMVADHLNRIWFGMDADSVANIPASIYCLNSDMSLNKKILMSAGHLAWNLKINGTGDEIYYFDNNGVNAISITDTIAPASPFSPVNSRNLYGLGVDPATGDVYVSDAVDYVQNSHIYRYDKTGYLIQTFTAGVISGNFAFNNE
jgi:uncharacterized protein DUF5074